MNELITSGLLIFAMRMVDVTLYTMRIMMVMRGRKPLAWIFAFCQSTLYVFIISTVLANLDNWFNILGYAAGFATGNVVGMWIEDRLAIGITHLRIISSKRGTELVQQLRECGYAVTEVAARGRDGMVTIINCSVRRREASDLTRLITKIDDQAFITAEAVRLVWQGFWPKSRTNDTLA